MSTSNRSLQAESYDSLASNPFTLHLTSGAVPELPSNQHSNYGFIALLALAQRLDIHFLPITWQAALGPLGEGGEAAINQALIHVQTSFAFKCFKNASRTRSLEQAQFWEVINEMIVLSHPTVRRHPHIVQLEGICWDISQYGRVWPVLVFEKAHLGDLDQFITSNRGSKMSTQDRLNLCVDIGIAIKDMHLNNILHGDIKPRNVLVFETEPNIFVARVADFGFSTRFCDEHDLVKVPMSHPWNAPEHHTRSFHAFQAIKMDIYSFGLLCLWLLFEGNSSLPLLSQTSSNDRQSASYKDIFRNIQKRDESLLRLSIGLVEECGDFSSDSKQKICQFFSSTLTSDPDKRSALFEDFLSLLIPTRMLPQSSKITDLEPLPDKEDFKLASSFYEFYNADFRVRLFIATELQSIASKQAVHSFQHISLRDAALQLALCYQVGFGVAKDAKKAKNFLDEYRLVDEELKHQVILIRDTIPQWDMQEGIFKNLSLQGYIKPINLSQHYQENALMERAGQTYVREIRDAEELLGHTHPLTLVLKYRLGRIMKDQGRLKDAEQLDAQVVETSKAVFGIDNQNTLNSMTNLASTYQDLGRWAEAEELKLEVVARMKRALGKEHPDTLTSIANLASVYRSQGRWHDAESLEMDVLEIRNSTLGQNHPETLASMGNLASTFWKQGRWTEAEQLELQTVTRSLKILGNMHPLTLTWMANLASTYEDQGRWRDAHDLHLQVMESMKKALGPDHPSTLTSMAKTASTLRKQGQLKEAEELLSQVVETRNSILGHDHPSTLTSMSNLGAIYQDQGRLEKAEELEIQVIRSSSNILGENHPDTITSAANLAAIYRKQRRWDEAEQLEMQVLKISIRELGEDHPDSITSAANLGATYWSQRRYAEAEKLLSQVVEKRRKLLREDHPSFLTAMGNLALACRSQAKWKEAEELEVQVMETRKRVLGEYHPHSLTSMNNLAHIFKSQGRFDEALGLMAKCVQMQKEKHGTNHPSTKVSDETLQCWQAERSP